MGESAGAMSVGLHMLNKTTDLFRGGVSTSAVGGPMLRYC